MSNAARLRDASVNSGRGSDGTTSRTGLAAGRFGSQPGYKKICDCEGSEPPCFMFR